MIGAFRYQGQLYLVGYSGGDVVHHSLPFVVRTVQPILE